MEFLLKEVDCSACCIQCQQLYLPFLYMIHLHAVQPTAYIRNIYTNVFSWRKNFSI